MSMIEEQAVVLSVEREYIRVEARASGGCNSCQSAGTCSTGLLSSLFSAKPGHLRVRNTVGARVGDTVTIGLDRLAMVVASLLTYLLPLLMLMAGAIIGESVAKAYASHYSDLFSIAFGIAFVAITFIFNRRIMNTGAMARMLQPRLLDNRGHGSI